MRKDRHHFLDVMRDEDVPSRVPDGDTTAALLGGALTALGLVRRKISA